jgi:prevent-host-death family protein
MRELGVLEVRTRLSALLAEMEQSGEPIAITRHGRRIARLVPEAAPRKSRKEAVEALIRWREQMARENPELNEPFDWKAAVEDGRE